MDGLASESAPTQSAPCNVGISIAEFVTLDSNTRSEGAKEQIFEKRYAIYLCTFLELSYISVDSASPWGLYFIILSSLKLVYKVQGGLEKDDQPSQLWTVIKQSRENIPFAWFVKFNHRMSFNVIAQKLKLQIATVQNIMTKNLNSQKVYANLIPKVLTDE